MWRSDSMHQVSALISPGVTWSEQGLGSGCLMKPNVITVLPWEDKNPFLAFFLHASIPRWGSLSPPRSSWLFTSDIFCLGFGLCGRVECPWSEPRIAKATMGHPSHCEECQPAKSPRGAPGEDRAFLERKGANLSPGASGWRARKGPIHLSSRICSLPRLVQAR